MFPRAIVGARLSFRPVQTVRNNATPLAVSSSIRLREDRRLVRRGLSAPQCRRLPPRRRFMIRRAKGLIPGALALLAAGLVLAVIAPAHAAQPMRHRHHVARYVAPRGDIVVHTGRS